MSFDQIYADYTNSSDQLLAVRQEMVALAASYGLKHTSYEAGPGWNVGTENSMGNYIIAQRLAPMRDVWKHDLLASWEVAGGDIYNQCACRPERRRWCWERRMEIRRLATRTPAPLSPAVSLFGSYSRFGMWGAAENFFNTSTPKYCAAMDALQAPAPPGCAGW